MQDNVDKKLILVIDDEPDLVTYLETLFSDNGYQTISASNGVEAMEKVQDKIPDLITLDISMPEKSGVRFYRELKTDPTLSSIPVLIITGITGYGGNADSFEQFLASRKQVPPPEGFIGKPLEDPNALLAKIGELVNS